MRLNDWKRQAEEYRDVDRAALEAAEKRIAEAKLPQYQVLRKIGRCANGAERGSGHIYHAVPGWAALCGTQPGRASAGWNNNPTPPEQAVTCPRYLKKIAKLAR